jgi:Uma2 family endonuclease
MNGQHKYRNAISEIPSNAIEVFRMLPEGTRCEVIFNELIMSPSPSMPHQLLLSDLHVLIYNFLAQNNLGKIIPALADVYLENYDSVIQPDLVVLLNDNLGLIKDEGIYGTPDIIVEILSKNKAYDTQRKKLLYEKAGVKEYFIIDPESKATTLFTLNNSGGFEKAYEETGILRSALLSAAITF